MATWEKQNSMLFIDTSETPSAPDWARLRKSTVFDLAFNPEVETLDFIDQQFPSDCTQVLQALHGAGNAAGGGRRAV